jgi:TrmH family RNA methyltransferase
MIAEPIRSRANPAVRRLRALRERGDPDLVLLEGPKLVDEALGSGVAVVEVAVSPRALRAAPGRALRARFSTTGVPIHLLDEPLVASLSELETSQGIVAVARRPRFEEDRLYAGVPLVVVAVAVQNPGNLGAVLRSAEAAGATGAYLTTGCADPFSWKALRGSMGSAFRLPHCRGVALGEALARLRARGVRVAAAVGSGGEAYDAMDLRPPLALLLGSEGAGLPEAARQAADFEVSIPLQAPVESLNVGVAAGVVLFEAARQRRAAERSGPAQR